MNNTKRLLSCLISVVMLLSLLSSYGLVFASIGGKNASDIDIGSTGVGAAPSTDMPEFDVMADDVLIVDSGLSIYHETYSLVWNNSQIDDIPVDNKVFKTITGAQAYALANGITQPKIIIAKVDAKTDSLKITMGLELYAQAYNTMPFVTGANTLDKWTYNTDDAAMFDDFADLTVALPKIEIGSDVTGKVAIYGYTLTGGIDATNAKNAFDLELVNTVIDGGNGAVINFEGDAFAADNKAKLLIKNMYVNNVSISTKLVSDIMPAFVTVDGLFVDKSQTPVEYTQVSQMAGKTNFTVKNSYFAGCACLFTFAGDKVNDMKRSNIKDIIFTSNIIDGALASGSVGGALTLTPSRYTSLKVTKNYMSSGVSDTSVPVIASVADENGYDELPFELEIKENIFNGFATDFELVSKTGAYRTTKINLVDNYLAPVYSASLKGVNGVGMTANAHAVTCKSFYYDYLLTNKKTGATTILSVSATNGDVFLNNSTNTVFYIMKSGDASELTITFASPETTFKWFADSDCTQQINAADITGNTAYIKCFYSSAEGDFESEPYTVTLVRETPSIPYFSETYTDPAGLLSSKALFCNVDCGWVSNGSLYQLEWQGTPYTFIKGVNLFESIEAATDFAKANEIENPEFVILDLSGSHTVTTKWFPSIPGSYFTVNYATKPYIGDPTVAPEDWKSNVGTGKGQYNVAEGITTAGIQITGSEPAGDYKLYGFTMTTGIADSRSSNRPGCVNIHLENCYYNVTSWTWAFFTAADAAPTTTEPTNDYLYIKNTYLNGNGFAARLFSGWQAANITFDGLFLHAGAYSTSEDYVKQNTKTASFRIINSHIKEYSTSLQNQGNNKTITAGENKTFEVSNSIFTDARIGKAFAITAYTQAWNQIIIKDNIFINTTLKDYPLFKYSLQATAGDNPCTLTVTGNKGYGMIGTFDFGSRALATGSVVKDNYITPNAYEGKGVTTYGGIKLSATSGTAPILTGDYWVDSDMTIRPNVFIEDYDFVGANVIFDKEAKTIKYIPLAQNEIGFVETEDKGSYVYNINLAHIVENKYGNKITVIYNGKTYALADVITFKSDTKVETVDLVIAVSSPDGSVAAVEYAVTITKDGPAIEGVIVDGQPVSFANGAYSAELSGRGQNESIDVITNKDTAQVVITDENGTPVTTVNVNNSETVVYTISVTDNGETVTTKLYVSRRGAELEEFDAIIVQASSINSNDWLKGFNGAFQTLLSKMKRVDRTTVTQAEVDDMTAQLKAIMDEAVLESDYKAFIRTAKRIKNTDGKYCDVSYGALVDAITAADAGVQVIYTAAEYNALIGAVETAMNNLSGHAFTTYKHDKGTETCVGNGTMTATCDNAGCKAKDTKAETGKYATGKHTFKDYVYNEDATHLADGTKTAICTECKKQTHTITAAGTKLTIINSASVFKDVKKDAWYKKFVDYVATYGFMNGTAADTFAPDKTITRAEFVKVLANFAGVDTSDNTVKTNFTDLKEGAWYVGAIKWASDNGITSGTSETTFSPDAKITREQMCVMIVAFANYAKLEIKPDKEKKTFSDDAQISSWAKEAVYACQMAGVIEGKGNGFDPKGSATRAEVSVIISIAHEKYILA